MNYFQLRSKPLYFVETISQFCEMVSKKSKSVVLLFVLAKTGHTPGLITSIDKPYT